MGHKRLHKPLSREEREARRLAAGWDLLNGMSQAGVAQKYDIDASVTCRWAKVVKEQGIEGLRATKAPGNSFKLSDEEIDRLKRASTVGPRANGFDGDKWSLKWIKELIEQKFDVTYNTNHISTLMNRLQFDWKAIRSSSEPSKKQRLYRPKLTREEMEKRRLAAIEDIKEGMSSKMIAERYGVTVKTANMWIQTYEKEGVEGLRATKARGKPSKLSQVQITQLREIVIAGAAAYGFEDDYWTQPRLQQMIKREFRVTYHVTSISRLMRRLGFSPQKPRKKAVERNEKQRQQWLSTVWEEDRKNW